MYLEHDMLLSREQPNIVTTEDAVRFMETFFPDIHETYNQDKIRKVALSFFIYIGYGVTQSELAMLFGPYFASHTTKNCIDDMCGKGTVQSLEWRHPDMGARKCAYALTTAGYNIYMQWIDDGFATPNGEHRLRRSKGIIPIHDYGVGLSLLSLFRLNAAFSMVKEKALESRDNIRQKGKVMVDCHIRFYASNDNYNIYLEQDMGTERASVLIAKIDSYYANRLLSPRDNCILISSHQVMPFPKAPRYTASWIQSTLDGMKKTGAGGVYDYYSRIGNTLNERDQKELEALLVDLGICYRYQLEKGGSHIGRTEVPDFTTSELVRYKDELKTFTNPYLIRAYNSEQEKVTSRKFRSLSTQLVSRVQDGLYDTVRFLLEGYSCLVLSSTLLPNYSSLYLPSDRSLIRRYLKAVSLYFPELEDWDYLELSRKFHIPDYPSIVFRNIFLRQDGRIVCFEHIGRDLGGFLRVFTAAGVSRAVQPSYPITIVAVCSSLADIIRFQEWTGYREESCPIIADDDGFHIYFLLEENIREEDGLAPLSYVDQRGVQKVFTGSSYSSENCLPGYIWSALERRQK